MFIYYSCSIVVKFEWKNLGKHKYSLLTKISMEKSQKMPFVILRMKQWFEIWGEKKKRFFSKIIFDLTPQMLTRNSLNLPHKQSQKEFVSKNVCFFCNIAFSPNHKHFDFDFSSCLFVCLFVCKAVAELKAMPTDDQLDEKLLTLEKEVNFFPQYFSLTQKQIYKPSPLFFELHQRLNPYDHV